MVYKIAFTCNSPANGGPVRLPIPWQRSINPYAMVKSSKETSSVSKDGVRDKQLAKNKPNNPLQIVRTT